MAVRLADDRVKLHALACSRGDNASKPALRATEVRNVIFTGNTLSLSPANGLQCFFNFTPRPRVELNSIVRKGAEQKISNIL